eukprot:PITA_13498
MHSDVFGPVKVPSLGKSMYYVSFIDDFSRNTWIYFLKKKFKVFDKFKEFKALVKNQIEKKIKVLRSDNGGEFRSKEFEEFCKKCVQPKEPENVEFELKEEEYDSTAEEESEDEEPQTPDVRRSVRERRKQERYSPYAFSSNFALSVTPDDPKTMMEEVDSEDGKLWKEAMVDEMESLHRNEA